VTPQEAERYWQNSAELANERNPVQEEVERYINEHSGQRTSNWTRDCMGGRNGDRARLLMCPGDRRTKASKVVLQ